MPLIAVLCGGIGARLRPLTENIPKPLVSVNGKPIIEYIVDDLERAGLEQIVLLGGYKVELLQAHFKSKPEIRITDTGEVDIARRLESVVPLVHDFAIVLYGDTISDINFGKLLEYFSLDPTRPVATVWQLKSDFGLFDVSADGVVQSYEEKPRLDKWINIGYMCLPLGDMMMLNRFKTFEDFLTNLVDSRRLRAFKHDGTHITINTREQLDAAESFLANKIDGSEYD